MKKGKKSKKFSCGFYASNLKKMPGKIITGMLKEAETHKQKYVSIDNNKSMKIATLNCRGLNKMGAREEITNWSSPE